MNRPDYDPSRSKFIEYCNNFAIVVFNIPRPLKSTIYGGHAAISDSQCVFIALSLMEVPHNVIINPELEPIGWLLGPHLMEKRLDRDWNLVFVGGELKRCLQVNPGLIFSDSSIQLAVAILRYKCKKGTPRESKWAKNILEELGLPLFIPEEARKKQTENLTLRYYSTRPVILISAVTLYEHLISEFLKQSYKNEGHKSKKEDIKKAFKFIFKKDMPNNLIYGERDKDNKAIALAFIHFETGAPYEALKKIYYNNTKDFSKYDVFEHLDLITGNKEDIKEIIKNLKKELKSKYPPHQQES